MIEDNWGDNNEVTDPYSESTSWLYRNGQCLALAIALAKRDKGQVLVQSETQETDEWDEENDEPFKQQVIYHAYYYKDGQATDIDGTYSLKTLEANNTSKVYEFSIHEPDEASYMWSGFMSEQNEEAALWVIESREQLKQ